MDHYDERLKALQKRSLQVLPLKYRRETPQKLLPIEALCEYETEEVQGFSFLTLLCMQLKALLIPVRETSAIIMSKHPKMLHSGFGYPLSNVFKSLRRP